MSAYCIHCNTENGHRPTCVMVWQGTPHDRLMAENSKLRAKIASLTAVLDAAREEKERHEPSHVDQCGCGFCEAIRTYDAGVKS